MIASSTVAKPVLLVVDDAPEYLSMMAACFESSYSVRLASSGRRGLQLALKEPQPDVVILDVLMPEMDGHAVLTALRADPRTHEIPVIFMTSLAESGDETAGLAEGAADYIIKPAPPQVMQARVRAQIELKQMRDGLREHIDLLNVEIGRRETLEKKLQQTVADLEAFSYTVSHDLRAPLAAIGGFTSSLQQTEAARMSPAGLRRLERVIANSQKMESMIDNILAFSRTSQGDTRMRPVDLDRLLAQVVEDAKQAYPYAEIDVGPLPGVAGDDAMLRQVFANLIDNALKFSASRPDARIEVGAGATDAATEIFVRDNGSGFDMAYADKLFGLFKRLHTQDEVSGTGVGLAIVKRLVDRHGGEVRAESVADGWTTFTISLTPSKALALS
jgi:two-component system sensor histidine kinase/response regulator